MRSLARRSANSISKAAFAGALEEQGFILARGDRRGFVAVDHRGEVHAISRWVGIKATEVRARLGAPDDPPDVAAAKARAAQIVVDRLDVLKAEHRALAKETLSAAAVERAGLRRRHQVETDAPTEDAALPRQSYSTCDGARRYRGGGHLRNGTGGGA